MPIRVQGDLPAREKLERENIFVMDEGRAEHQDIRPLEIAILNLMPLKEETELDGKDVELLTVRGNPKRDPRRHTVSIFYIIKVDPDAQPKGADDAKDAKFYDLKDIY